MDSNRATVCEALKALDACNRLGCLLTDRTWAELVRCDPDIDVLHCPDCVGRLRFVAAILLSSAIRRILHHLERPSDRAAAHHHHPERGELQCESKNEVCQMHGARKVLAASAS